MGKLRETETEQAVLVLSSVPVPGPCLCRGLAMLFTLWVLDSMGTSTPWMSPTPEEPSLCLS